MSRKELTFSTLMKDPTYRALVFHQLTLMERIYVFSALIGVRIPPGKCRSCYRMIPGGRMRQLICKICCNSMCQNCKTRVPTFKDMIVSVCPEHAFVAECVVIANNEVEHPQYYDIITELSQFACSVLDGHWTMGASTCYKYIRIDDEKARKVALEHTPVPRMMKRAKLEEK